MNNDEAPRVGGCPQRQARPPPHWQRDPSEGSVRPHQHRQDDEEKYGKLKFTMSKFKEEQDPEAYLSWELKVDKMTNAILVFSTNTNWHASRRVFEQKKEVVKILVPT